MFFCYNFFVNLIKQKLTPEQEKKTRECFRIINFLNKAGRENGLRIIIAGGFAVDGFFGEITRYHNDIDIQIYGMQENARETVDNLLAKINISGLKYVFEDKGRKEYYHYLVYKLGDLILDIGYIRTKTNPLGKEKFIIKSNGEVDEQEFHKQIFGKNGEISFEITDPLDEMNEKIYKREERGDPKRPEHDQDISNLKLVLDINK
jgi:hypothetical protein